ncbi:hypothetical protein [Chitinophaga nivalis]|uniref:Uncharacterized protein n=1 Tax=Chitinophaga nivalis TaxID=2991709 RepID=A0ABT3IFA1_9BACT|nr:hypothetical protein [Chitinophaga nivalis]MCW3467854.1 hypothetical protein [Chitinophaga nivalis]MCW3482454.1 hypothetical protein [Chitinophaga nivalis]
MKKIILVLVCSIIFFSCRKESTTPALTEADYKAKLEKLIGLTDAPQGQSVKVSVENQFKTYKEAYEALSIFEKDTVIKITAKPILVKEQTTRQRIAGFDPIVVRKDYEMPFSLNAAAPKGYVSATSTVKYTCTWEEQLDENGYNVGWSSVVNVHAPAPLILSYATKTDNLSWAGHSLTTVISGSTQVGSNPPQIWTATVKVRVAYSGTANPGIESTALPSISVN